MTFEGRIVTNETKIRNIKASVKMTSNKDRQTLQGFLENLLNRKYTTIDDMYCREWSRTLQQKLAKKDVTIRFDWPIITKSLILNRYVDVGQLLQVSNVHRLSVTSRSNVEKTIEEKLQENGSWDSIEIFLKELPTIICAQGIINSMLQELGTNETYRSYLHNHLKEIVFRYNDNEREFGYLSQDGTQMVHYIDVLNKTSTRLHWINRPCTLTSILENHTGFLYYSLTTFMIPEFHVCIKGVMKKSITIQVEWDSITDDDRLECYRSLHNIESALVIQRISRAFDDISAFEVDEVVEAIGSNVTKISIRHTQRKHHMYDKQTKTVKLHLVLSDDVNGLYDIDDYYSIFKYSGLSCGNKFPVELINSASQLPCLRNNISIPIKEYIQRNLIWTPNLEEKKAFEACQRFIDQKFNIDCDGYDMVASNRRSRTFSFMANASRGSFFKSVSAEATLSPVRSSSVHGRNTMEQPVHAWHVVKYNNSNMAQERILFLTTHAYYVFRYDFAQGKLDEGHFKRHDLQHLDIVDIGDSVVKIYTRERVGRSLFSKFTGKDETAIDRLDNQQHENNVFTSDYLTNHPRLRIHKERPARKRPETKGLYNNVFTFFERSKAEQVVEEIGWTVFGVSVIRKGTKGVLPFRSKGVKETKGVNVGALLYNKLGFGLTSDRNEHWCEFFNPMYNKKDMISQHGSLQTGASKLTISELASPMVTDDELTDSSEVETYEGLDEEERNQKIMEKYKVEQQIGSGNEGAIYLATNHRQRKVAIKAVAYGEREKLKVDTELQLVKLISHHNIVKMHETFVLTSETIIGFEQHMYMVMEYCDTTLEKVIQLLSMKGDTLASNLLVSWVEQVAKGIAFMHKNNIMHRDIKTENILVKTHDPKTHQERNPTNWKMKVCDFGFATQLNMVKRKSSEEAEEESNQLYGTPLYMAPEIATFKQYDLKADVWSFGVLVVQLLMQKPATAMPNIFEQMSREPNYLKKLIKENDFHEQMAELALRCCSLNPEERPSMDQILSDYFYT